MLKPTTYTPVQTAFKQPCQINRKAVKTPTIINVNKIFSVIFSLLAHTGVNKPHPSSLDLYLDLYLKHLNWLDGNVD